MEFERRILIVEMSPLEQVQLSMMDISSEVFGSVAGNKRAVICLLILVCEWLGGEVFGCAGLMQGSYSYSLL